MCLTVRLGPLLFVIVVVVVDLACNRTRASLSRDRVESRPLSFVLRTDCVLCLVCEGAKELGQANTQEARFDRQIELALSQSLVALFGKA